MEIEIRGEKLCLLPEKALWWEAQKTLVVADLHWGKTAHFRKNGIAIPNASQTGDEMKLAALIRILKAERLVIAGDLFHSRSNKQVETFKHFRTSHAGLHIDLVMGNHDILPRAQYDGFDLQHHPTCLEMEPFCFAHDAIENAHFVIHGHVHPSVRLTGKGHQSLKLCCFAEEETRMILPAFGSFTGTFNLEIKSWKHIYVVAEKEVIRWK